MNQIKSVLKEELERSKHLLKKYQEALLSELEGSLVEKIIKGKKYFYLAMRREGKVIFKYLGKLNNDDILKYKKSKEKKAQYRKLIKELKEQIRYLEKVVQK